MDKPRILAVFSCLVLCCSGIQSQALPDQSVVAERGTIKLTLTDLDSALEAIPAEDRSAVVNGADRLHHIIDTELLNKQMAQKGREMKLTELPEVQRSLSRAAEQALAKVTLAHILGDAQNKEFGTLANEYYLANLTEFSTPISSVVQHILVSKTGRSSADIKHRIVEISDKIMNSESSFEALISEYSDDPSKADNDGVMTVAEPGQFVLAFEKAAQALKMPGDISAPVETEFGTHILRLVSRKPAETKPFGVVRAEIIEKLDAEYKQGIQTKLFSDLRSANPIFHQEVMEIVQKRYGELPSMNSMPVSLPALDSKTTTMPEGSH